MLKHSTYKTPVGNLLSYFDNQKLICVCLNEQKSYWEEKLELTKSQKSELPVEIKEKLDAYFKGETSALKKIPISPRGSEFQKKVWSELRKIPAGQTKSYAKLASKLGKPSASRAVGNACGQNPLLLFIPCHRITRSDGELGGFSAGVGIKKKLLQHESSYK